MIVTKIDNNFYYLNNFVLQPADCIEQVMSCQFSTSLFLKPFTDVF